MLGTLFNEPFGLPIRFFGNEAVIGAVVGFGGSDERGCKEKLLSGVAITVLIPSADSSAENSSSSKLDACTIVVVDSTMSVDV